jgi:hypothetical protein
MWDVDKIIVLMTKAYTNLDVRQLRVSNPGDDDGLWFFRQPDSPFEVQIESSTGMCPFLIETDENDRRMNASTVDEAIEILSGLLHFSKTKTSECHF